MSEAARPPIPRFRLNKFLKNLPIFFDLPLEDIVKLFKARTKDVFAVAYNKDCTKFAISYDCQKWYLDDSFTEPIEGFVTLPERGTIWQMHLKDQLFLVMDFVNLRTTDAFKQPPLVVYMDELGRTWTTPVIMWHSEMKFHISTVTNP